MRNPCKSIFLACLAQEEVATLAALWLSAFVARSQQHKVTPLDKEKLAIQMINANDVTAVRKKGEGKGAFSRR